MNQSYIQVESSKFKSLCNGAIDGLKNWHNAQTTKLARDYSSVSMKSSSFFSKNDKNLKLSEIKSEIIQNQRKFINNTTYINKLSVLSLYADAVNVTVDDINFLHFWQSRTCAKT